MSKTTILLPRIVPQVHDATYERSALVDPLAWGVPELTAMVSSFTRLSGASTVPSLKEWPILPDKVRPAQETPSRRKLSKAAASYGECMVRGRFPGCVKHGAM